MASIQDYQKRLLKVEEGSEQFTVEALKEVALDSFMESGLVLDENDSLRPYTDFVDTKYFANGKNEGASKDYARATDKSLFKVLSGRIIEGGDSEKAGEAFKAIEVDLINESKKGGLAYNYASFYNFKDIEGGAESKCAKTWDFYYKLIGSPDYIDIPGIVGAKGEDVELTVQDALIKSNMQYFAVNGVKLFDRDKNGLIKTDKKGNPLYKKINLSPREKYAVSTLATNLLLRAIAREGEETAVDDLVEQLNGALAYILNPRDEKNNGEYIYSKEERKEAGRNVYTLSDEQLFSIALKLASDRVESFNKILKEKGLEEIKVDLAKVRHDEGVKAQLERKVGTIQEMAIDFNGYESTKDTDQAKLSYINPEGHLLGISDEKFAGLKKSFKEINRILFKDEKTDSFETIYKQLIVDFLLINDASCKIDEETKKKFNEAVIIPMSQGAENVDLDAIFNEAAKALATHVSMELTEACLEIGISEDELKRLQDNLTNMLILKDIKAQERDIEEENRRRAADPTERDILLGKMMELFDDLERQFTRDLKIYKQELTNDLAQEKEVLDPKVVEKEKALYATIDEAEKLVKTIVGLGFDAAEDVHYKRVAEMKKKLQATVKEASKLAEGIIAQRKAEMVTEELATATTQLTAAEELLGEAQAAETARQQRNAQAAARRRETRARNQSKPQAEVVVVTEDGTFSGRVKKVEDTHEGDPQASVTTQSGSYTGRLERK